MLHCIKQTDRDLLRPIQKYGCLFLCFAQASPMIFAGEEGRKALNAYGKRRKSEVISLETSTKTEIMTILARLRLRTTTDFVNSSHFPVIMTTNITTPQKQYRTM